MRVTAARRPQDPARKGRNTLICGTRHPTGWGLINCALNGSVQETESVLLRTLGNQKLSPTLILFLLEVS